MIQFLQFIGFYGVFHYAYFLVPDEIFREVIYYRGVGLVCADMVNSFFPLEDVTAVQNHLISSRANLEIVRGCDGAGALFLVIAAILAFPSTLGRKAIGLVLGVLLMYSLNLVRIGGLYFVVAYHRDWFQVVHTYLAPTLIIALGCLFFAWWAFTSSRTDHEPR